jgi:hypothetical protein
VWAVSTTPPGGFCVHLSGEVSTSSRAVLRAKLAVTVIGMTVCLTSCSHLHPSAVLLRRGGPPSALPLRCSSSSRSEDTAMQPQKMREALDERLSHVCAFEAA